jgi:hypothetical protein
VNFTDGGPGYAESAGYGDSAFSVAPCAPDRLNFASRQLRIRMSLSSREEAGATGVLPVFGMRDVFKIRRRWIGFVAIDVVDLVARRTGTNERLGNESM